MLLDTCGYLWMILDTCGYLWMILDILDTFGYSWITWSYGVNNERFMREDSSFIIIYNGRTRQRTLLLKEFLL